MNKIITYNKGGILGLELDPKKDIVISMTDYCNKPIDINSNVKCLHLQFDDINDNSLNFIEKLSANLITKESHIKAFSRVFNSGWPFMPFTKYHARKILDFSLYTKEGYHKNWHINCEYGRSRSAAIAMFLSSVYPNHEVVLKRDVSRPNTRVLRMLNKEWGIQ